MGRKLTPKEIEDRVIGRILKRIKSIAEVYGSQMTRSACQRYANREREEIRLQKEIKEKEKELTNLKKHGDRYGR